MEVKAKAKYLRIAPRKSRLVVDLIRGLDVDIAVSQLNSLNKKAGRMILKLLNSAIANAENNFSLQKSNLYIKTVTVDDGPTFYRWMPRAFGRATPIRKRTSHIILILDERVPTEGKKSVKSPATTAAKVKASDVKKNVKADSVQTNEEQASGTDDSKNEEAFDAKKQGRQEHHKNNKMKTKNDKGFLKQVFRRKSGE